MRIVLDTNVFVSAVFFGGYPNQILRAWRDGGVELAVSAEILEEYRRVGEKLTEQFAGIDLSPLLGLLIANARIVADEPLPKPICQDPDDDKFLACAVASGARVVVSGDKHLLRVSQYRRVRVLRPRAFVERHLL